MSEWWYARQLLVHFDLLFVLLHSFCKVLLLDLHLADKGLKRLVLGGQGERGWREKVDQGEHRN